MKRIKLFKLWLYCVFCQTVPCYKINDVSCYIIWISQRCKNSFEKWCIRPVYLGHNTTLQSIPTIVTRLSTKIQRNITHSLCYIGWHKGTFLKCISFFFFSLSLINAVSSKLWCKHKRFMDSDTIFLLPFS